jgi:hypothetical protein
MIAVRQLKSPKREKLMFARLMLAVIFLSLVGCEKGPPEKAQLILDRDSLGDGGVDFGAVFVGTRPQESLMIRNGGVATLNLESVVKAGDGAFTIRGTNEDGSFPKEVKGLDQTYVQIIFAPNAERTYSGTITITSDAENAPSRVVSVAGRGVAVPPMDGGM